LEKEEEVMTHVEVLQHIAHLLQLVLGEMRFEITEQKPNLFRVCSDSREWAKNHEDKFVVLAERCGFVRDDKASRGELSTFDRELQATEHVALVDLRPICLQRGWLKFLTPEIVQVFSGVSLSGVDFTQTSIRCTPVPGSEETKISADFRGAIFSSEIEDNFRRIFSVFSLKDSHFDDELVEKIVALLERENGGSWWFITALSILKNPQCTHAQVKRIIVHLRTFSTGWKECSFFNTCLSAYNLGDLEDALVAEIPIGQLTGFIEGGRRKTFPQRVLNKLVARRFVAAACDTQWSACSSGCVNLKEWELGCGIEKEVEEGMLLVTYTIQNTIDGLDDTIPRDLFNWQVIGREYVVGRRQILTVKLFLLPHPNGRFPFSNFIIRGWVEVFNPGRFPGEEDDTYILAEIAREAIQEIFTPVLLRDTAWLKTRVAEHMRFQEEFEERVAATRRQLGVQTILLTKFEAEQKKLSNQKKEE
jgi:hypothetical protein